MHAHGLGCPILALSSERDPRPNVDSHLWYRLRLPLGIALESVRDRTSGDMRVYVEN